MVVVGGKSSANTKRLAEIAKDMGCPVFLVETEDELDLDEIAKYECVGVTAGASTPLQRLRTSSWRLWVASQMVLKILPPGNRSRIKLLSSAKIVSSWVV
jgi:hypothetical protein